MFKKCIYLVLVVALFLATTPAMAVTFTDVTEHHDWAQEAISALIAEKIIIGVGDNKFAPDDKVSKEQFAKMLCLGLGVAPDTEASQTYIDVPDARWSYTYIEAIKEHFPIEEEARVNMFLPQKAYLRQEVAAAIVNGMGLADKDYDTSKLEETYSDFDDIRDDLKTQLAIAVDCGILQGFEDKIRPEAPVTRAEAAVFIHRMMTYEPPKEEEPSGDNEEDDEPALMGTPMVGESQVSVEQAKRWATNRGAHQRFIDIADTYWKYGELTGIRPEVLYAQAAKETAFGKYGGRVVPEQNNWAGIKTATANGDATYDHESFDTPDDGVRAHFNHMCAYLGLEPVGEPHDRYFVASRTAWAGTVTTAEELSGKWAPAADYGSSLVENFLKPMMES